MSTENASQDDVQRTEDHIMYLLSAHIREEEQYRRMIEKRIEQNEELIRQQVALIAAQTAEVVALKLVVERYKGAVGLLMLAGSAIFAAATLSKEFILGWLK